MHDTIVVATADATMVVAMDMAELQPVRLSAVRFSAGCWQRLTTIGAASITIQIPATTHTDLLQGVQRLTACDDSNRMIVVAAHI
jgi:ribosomal protein L18E